MKSVEINSMLLNENKAKTTFFPFLPYKAGK